MRNFRELPHLAFSKSYGDFLRPAHRQRRNPRRRCIQHISDEATQQGGLAAFGSRNRRQARGDLVGNPKREISAIRSNPNRDVIHRWRKAYPALENAETTPSVLV